MKLPIATPFRKEFSHFSFQSCIPRSITAFVSSSAGLFVFQIANKILTLAKVTSWIRAASWNSWCDQITRTIFIRVCESFLGFFPPIALWRNSQDSCPQLQWCVSYCCSNTVSYRLFFRYLNTVWPQFLWDASVCSQIDNLIQYFIHTHTTHIFDTIL